MVTPSHDNVDGIVWTKDAESNATLRLNVATGMFDNLGNVKDVSGHPLGAYGIPSDAANDLYFLNFGGAEIGRIDAKTKLLTIYPTPTAKSRPRRGRTDAQNRLWFAEYGVNAVGMFDPKTETIKEWTDPLGWESPYDVVPGRNGEVWTASMLTDRVARLNPATNEWINYPLPHQDQYPPRLCRWFKRPRRGLGSAASTAPPSSRSSRWTDRAATIATACRPPKRAGLRGLARAATQRRHL